MSTGGKINLQDGTGAFQVSLKAQDTALAADVTWTLPSADGSAGQMLATDGSGVLSWSNTGEAELYADVTLTTSTPSLDILPTPPTGKYYAIKQIDAAAQVNSTPLTTGRILISTSSTSTPSTTYIASSIVTATSSTEGTVVGSISRNSNAVTSILATEGFQAIQTDAANSSKNVLFDFDSNNVLYKCYYYYDSATSTYKIQVYKLINNTWEALTVINSGNNNLTTKFVIINDIPYVLYNPSASLKVQKYESGSWMDVGASFGDSSSRTNLVFDNNNNPYVIAISSSKVKIYYYNGSTWSTITSALNTSTANSISSVFSTVDNSLYVSYYDSTEGIVVKKYLSGSWSTVGSVPSSATYISTMLMLELTSDNTPYLSLNTSTSPSNPKVLRYINGNWESIGTFTQTTNNGSYFKIYNDFLYLFIINSTLQNYIGNAVLLKYENNNWVTIYSFYSSIANMSISNIININNIDFDNIGIPHISFQTGDVYKTYTYPTDTNYFIRVYYSLRYNLLP